MTNELRLVSQRGYRGDRAKQLSRSPEIGVGEGPRLALTGTEWNLLAQKIPFLRSHRTYTGPKLCKPARCALAASAGAVCRHLLPVLGCRAGPLSSPSLNSTRPTLTASVVADGTGAAFSCARAGVAIEPQDAQLAQGQWEIRTMPILFPVRTAAQIVPAPASEVQILARRPHDNASARRGHAKPANFPRSNGHTSHAGRGLRTS